MPKEEKKEKKVDVKKELEVKEENLDEKELLHEAEEREKQRKEKEEKEKEEAKVAAKEAKNKKLHEKKTSKATVRVKPRHGKKHRTATEKIEKGKEYSIEEGIKLAKETALAKFDATMELHIKISKKQENVRGTYTLPGGAVKQKKVLQVTDKNVEEVAANIKAGKIDFDIVVAHPNAMPKLAMVAKILGPKGLMPNPKSGTVAEDVKTAAEEFLGGRVEYKADKSNIVHMAIAKVSTVDNNIMENIQATLSQFPTNRIESVYLTTSMGPSVKISIK